MRLQAFATPATNDARERSFIVAGCIVSARPEPETTAAGNNLVIANNFG